MCAVAVQSSSCVWLFATPWTAAWQASLSLTISWSLPKFISLVMPSSSRILWCPLLLLPSVFPSIRVFSNESAVHIRWPKYWSFNFSVSPFNEYSGLISLGLSRLISVLSKELSRVFSSTTIWKHQFFGVQPSLWSNSCFCTRVLEKNTALTIWTSVGKVMFLLSNMLPRFVNLSFQGASVF